MDVRKLLLLSLGVCIATAAVGQERQRAAQEQPNQPKPSATLKLKPANAARTATGIKDGQQQDQQDRRERAEKVAAGLQKKANDTASAAASNVK